MQVSQGRSDTLFPHTAIAAGLLAPVGTAADSGFPVIEKATTRNIGKRLRKLFRLIREGRVDQLVRHFFDVMPRSVFHVDVLYLTELTSPNHAVRRPRQLRVREVQSGDVPELARVFHRENPGELAARLTAGHPGFVCETPEGDIVAMAWLNLGSEHGEPEKFCRFALPDDAAWEYDLWILPEWRIRGAIVALLFHTFEFVRTRGRTRLFGYASWHNRESLASHRSFGHRIVGRVLVINVLGVRVCRHRRVVPPKLTRTQIGFRVDAIVDLASDDRLGGREA